MAIELNRFLALTVALATGAACLSSCTVTDDDDDNGQAGSGNDQAGSGNAQAGSGNTAGRQEEENGGASNAGTSNAAGAGQAGAAQAGASNAAGAANAGAANGGEAVGGASTAGAANGGEAMAGAPNGGAATAGTANGGAATAGAANAGAANAGAAGEACLGNDPAEELDCSTGFPTKDCSDDDPAYEGYLNLVVDACEALASGSYYYGPAVSGVRMAAAACLTEITVDPCSEDVDDAVAACKAEAAANACETSIAAELCSADEYTDEWDETYPGILASCPELSAEDCVAAVSVWASPANIAQCMNPDDPSGEIFDASFEGTCTERFAVCSKF